MIVTLIRHGETIWQAEGRYQGVSDIPLSSSGAAKLCPAEYCPDVVHVTGLMRTAQTAAIIFPEARQVCVPGLEEMDFGVFEGKNYRELTGRRDYQNWVDGGCLGTCPGGENKAGFCRRVCAAFEELMAENADEPELTLVAHGGTLMAALERYGWPKRDYFDWHCPCGHGFRLEAVNWERERTLRLLGPVSFTGGD